MTVYFPSYYKKFRCIAEKCRHSCCVGWEISVDSATLKKYNALGREDILRHFDGDVIRLSEGDRCPFLCSDGLCRLISELGEGYTSLICREHPRFYHKSLDRIEGGIGASCEEAARIILTSDDYAEFVEFEREECDAPIETKLDTYSVIQEIYCLLSNREIAYHTRIEMLRERFGIPTAIHTPKEWQAEFDTLEFLNDAHREIISVGGTDSSEKNAAYFERFLAYLIFRHVGEAEHLGQLQSRIAFCILLTEMLENYSSARECTEQEIIDAARVISEEIEYSEDNTAALILEIESII